MRNVLKNVATTENNIKWKQIIKREEELYSRGIDTYNKILRF